MKDETLYEAVKMTLAQAKAVAEVLSCGSVVWQYRHTYPTDTAIVRPMGCTCQQCNPRPIHETLTYPCGCSESGVYPLPLYCQKHANGEAKP
jgi:hypothetical protein